MSLTDISIGFIGAGNMASALMRGLLAAQVPAERIGACDLDRAKLAELSTELGIGIERSAEQIIAECDVVFLAMKPKAVLEFLHEKIGQGPLWISVAAGVSCEQIEEALVGAARVVRAMPNTPALVSEGATGLCGGRYLNDQDLALAAELLAVVGTTVVVEENVMDAVTGLSGSGPAYVMMIVEALADGGVRAGLGRDVAMALASQTVRGAATLIQKSGKHPGQLKDMVTSPGGTTICGVQVLEQRGVRGALIDAVYAAAQQSQQLSKK